MTAFVEWTFVTLRSRCGICAGHDCEHSIDNAEPTRVSISRNTGMVHMGSRISKPFRMHTVPSESCDSFGRPYPLHDNP